LEKLLFSFAVYQLISFCSVCGLLFLLFVWVWVVLWLHGFGFGLGWFFGVGCVLVAVWCGLIGAASRPMQAASILVVGHVDF
jgi:hypothetical protein